MAVQQISYNHNFIRKKIIVALNHFVPRSSVNLSQTAAATRLHCDTTLAATTGAMAEEEPAESYQEVIAIRLNSSEYALQAVFTQFEALADNKIKLMLSTSIVWHPSFFTFSYLYTHISSIGSAD